LINASELQIKAIDIGRSTWIRKLAGLGRHAEQDQPKRPIFERRFRASTGQQIEDLHAALDTASLRRGRCCRNWRPTQGRPTNRLGAQEAPKKAIPGRLSAGAFGRERRRRSGGPARGAPAPASMSSRVPRKSTKT